jgi:hypothetical protein
MSRFEARDGRVDPVKTRMGRIGSMKRLASFLAVVAVALAAASPAFAQSATRDAYGSSGTGVLGAVSNGGGSNGGGSGGGVSPSTASSTPVATPQQVVAASSGSSLPFTGLDVGLLVAGGIVLVGVGIGLRRFARPLS